MVSKKRFALKALVTMVTLVIVGYVYLLTPQSATVRKSNEITTFQLESSAFQELKSTRQRNKVDSVFTLVPELPKYTTLLIIITTVPYEIKRRSILRQTWAKQSSWTFAANNSDSLPDSVDIVNITYFFMMGFDGYSPVDERVQRESTVHRDILRVNLTETYRGLINKILLTFKWVSTLDMKPLFIAKADHDVYVKMPELASWLQKFSRSPWKVYAGFIIRKATAKRDIKSPWYVSKQHYRGIAWPPYCRGPFYLFSRDLFLDVVNATKVIKPFPVEDVYMAVLAKSVGVNPLETGRVLFNDSRRLNRRVLQTPLDEMKVPSGIVLGDSLCSEAILRIHRVYTLQKLPRATKEPIARSHHE